MVGRSHPLSHVTFLSRGHVTNEKDLYLHFRDTYSIQIWQNSSFRLEDSARQVPWSFDHVVTWKLKNLYLHFNSICGRQTWQPSTKSREHLTKWSLFVAIVTIILKSDSHLRKKLWYLLDWKPIKNDKDKFNVLNALFVLKIFKFLPGHFVHVGKTAWLERQG